MENYQNLINEALGGGTPKECYNNLMDILQEKLTNKFTAIVLTEEELQQEKDKFAVGFTEWKEKNKYNKGIINYWKTGKDHEIPLEFSLSQLIDIYKEELANKK